MVKRLFEQILLTDFGFKSLSNAEKSYCPGHFMFYNSLASNSSDFIFFTSSSMMICLYPEYQSPLHSPSLYPWLQTPSVSATSHQGGHPEENQHPKHPALKAHTSLHSDHSDSPSVSMNFCSVKALNRAGETDQRAEAHALYVEASPWVQSHAPHSLPSIARSNT